MKNEKQVDLDIVAQTLVDAFAHRDRTMEGYVDDHMDELFRLVDNVAEKIVDARPYDKNMSDDELQARYDGAKDHAYAAIARVCRAAVVSPLNENGGIAMKV